MWIHKLYGLVNFKYVLSLVMTTIQDRTYVMPKLAALPMVISVLIVTAAIVLVILG